VLARLELELNSWDAIFAVVRCVRRNSTESLVNASVARPRSTLIIRHSEGVEDASIHCWRA